jgi:hypothetical protein
MAAPSTAIPNAEVSPFLAGPLLDGKISDLTGLQIAGLQFALFVLASILLLAVVLIWRSGSTVPDLPSGLTADQLELRKAWAELNSAYSKSAADRTLSLAQLFITGTLLPVLTAVLGYLFGKKED